MCDCREGLADGRGEATFVRKRRMRERLVGRSYRGSIGSGRGRCGWEMQVK